MPKQQTRFQSFSLGDTVSWRSQAAGSTTKKTGVIVEVVPTKCFPKQHRFKDNGPTYGRDHTSYVVEVELKRKGRKPKMVTYWPYTSQLKLVKGNEWLVVDDPATSHETCAAVVDTEPCDHTRRSCEEVGCAGPTRVVQVPSESSFEVKLHAEAVDKLQGPVPTQESGDVDTVTFGEPN